MEPWKSYAVLRKMQYLEINEGNRDNVHAIQNVLERLKAREEPTKFQWLLMEDIYKRIFGDKEES